MCLPQYAWCTSARRKAVLTSYGIWNCIGSKEKWSELQHMHLWQAGAFSSSLKYQVANSEIPSGSVYSHSRGQPLSHKLSTTPLLSATLIPFPCPICCCAFSSLPDFLCSLPYLLLWSLPSPWSSECHIQAVHATWWHPYHRFSCLCLCTEQLAFADRIPQSARVRNTMHNRSMSKMFNLTSLIYNMYQQAILVAFPMSFWWLLCVGGWGCYLCSPVTSPKYLCLSLAACTNSTVLWKPCAC